MGKGRLFILMVLLMVVTERLLSQDFYKIEKLSFNTGAFDELSPVPYLNGLVFTSNRRVNLFKTHSDSKTGTLMNNIWFVERNEKGKWKSPRLFSSSLASFAHEGPAVFNSRGNIVYFTRRLDGSRKEEMTLGIFIAQNDRNQWGNVKAFPYNSPKYNNAHPSLSVDGTQLFFVSDMPGGTGGMDIYVSVLENGQWSSPKNLGPSINTRLDEAFPTIHASGRLYFSSKGHGSKGGFDLFFSERINDSWLMPARLEAPFNSPLDDFSYIADTDFQTGYFTSNRERTDNIYSFKSLIPQFTACSEIEKDNYCFVLWEETGHIDPLSFKVEWELGDGTILKGVEVEHCYKTTGDYDISLNVVDALTGKFQYREASYLLSVKNVEQVVITSVDNCFVNEDVRFDGFKTNLPGISIQDYFWDFGDGTKAIGNSQTHRFGKPGLYKVSLGIASRPDASGAVVQKCSYKIVNVVVR